MVIVSELCSVIFSLFSKSMIDISADEGWLATTLRLMHLVQMCVQGRWISDSSILSLPHLNTSHLAPLRQELEKSHVVKSLNLKGLSTLPELLTLCHQDQNFVSSAVQRVIDPQQSRQVRVQ